MYRILGNELNLWIGVILITGRLGYRSFLYPGQIILGNWPHMLDNGSHLSAWDVLSLGTFCLGKFCLGTFCMCVYLDFQYFIFTLLKTEIKI